MPGVIFPEAALGAVPTRIPWSMTEPEPAQEHAVTPHNRYSERPLRRGPMAIRTVTAAFLLAAGSGVLLILIATARGTVTWMPMPL